MAKRSETDLAFFSRRAMEESLAAASASSPAVGAAHRHMAAAYAALLRDEQEAMEAMEAVHRDLGEETQQTIAAEIKAGPSD